MNFIIAILKFCSSPDAKSIWQLASWIRTISAGVKSRSVLGVFCVISLLSLSRERRATVSLAHPQRPRSAARIAFPLLLTVCVLTYSTT